MRGVLALLVTGLLAWGCSSGEASPWNAPPPTSGGTAGAGTSGSSGAQGGTSGSAGDSGSGMAGAAGASGAGGTDACDGACGGSTPVCDETSKTCVGCLGNEDCEGSASLCDRASNTCVECRSNDDCTDATASKCDAGVCTGCGANVDCSHIAGKTVCDTEASECVECTGTDYSACGEDMGTPLVCDTLLRTCTSNKEHGGDLCKACVSDAHCKLGQMCAMQRAGDPVTEVGYFCFWKQGDTTNGAPADCFSEGDPYAGVELNETSIDGQIADICSLRVSSCVALSELSVKDCKSGGSGDDSLCGAVPPDDAKCDQVGVSSNYVCTMTCVDNRDCPGISCNMSTFVCDL